MNEPFVEMTLACGATHAATLPADRISLDAVFRDICQSNACGNYGKCYMCPPDVGDIHEMMAQLRTYRNALLYQTIHALEDSFDYEGMVEAGARHSAVSQALEKRLREGGMGRYLHLSAGGCKVCEVCAKRENLPCRQPDLAMPSLESYGVNVYQTAQQAGLAYINGQDTVTYFGMVLWGEA
mgnify:CR=1 FL=1